MCMFQHSRFDEIRHYTARRLGCSLGDLARHGSVIVPAIAPFDDNLLITSAFNEANVICLTQLKNFSVVRKHQHATDAVESVLQTLDLRQSLEPATFLHVENVTQNGSAEPYFYLDRADFQPFYDSHVITLSKENPEHCALVETLHHDIEEEMRWFVEIDHPVVYGYKLDDILIGVSSHFLFEDPDFKIAAAGALVHPGYRKRKVGKALVSALCQWAIDQNYIVEWSSWDGNHASIALARSLGFRQFSSDYEFTVTVPALT